MWQRSARDRGKSNYYARAVFSIFGTDAIRPSCFERPRFRPERRARKCFDCRPARRLRSRLDGLSVDRPRAVPHPARHVRGLCLGSRIPARLQPASALLGLGLRRVVSRVASSRLGVRRARRAQRGNRPRRRLVADRRFRARGEAVGGFCAAAADAVLHLRLLQIRRQHDLPFDLAVDAAFLLFVVAGSPARRGDRVRGLHGPRPDVEILRADPARDLWPRRDPDPFLRQIYPLRRALDLGFDRRGDLRPACLLAADA